MNKASLTTIINIIVLHEESSTSLTPADFCTTPKRFGVSIIFWHPKITLNPSHLNENGNAGGDPENPKIRNQLMFSSKDKIKDMDEKEMQEEGTGPNVSAA